MEATVAAMRERQKFTANAQQRNLFETFKNQFHANMRGWRNRLAFAEVQRMRRRRAEARRAAQQKESA